MNNEHLTPLAELRKNIVAAGAMLAAVGFITMLVMNLVSFWP
jgi:hypothetical protein